MALPLRRPRCIISRSGSLVNGGYEEKRRTEAGRQARSALYQKRKAQAREQGTETIAISEARSPWGAEGGSFSLL